MIPADDLIPLSQQRFKYQLNVLKCSTFDLQICFKIMDFLLKILFDLLKCNFDNFLVVKLI